MKTTVHERVHKKHWIMRHALSKACVVRTTYVSIESDKICLDCIGQDMPRLRWTRYASIVLDKTCLDCVGQDMSRLDFNFSIQWVHGVSPRGQFVHTRVGLVHRVTQSQLVIATDSDKYALASPKTNVKKWQFCTRISFEWQVSTRISLKVDSNETI